MSWNPKNYLNFSDERSRPALDLLQQIELTHSDYIVDLGCGAGNIIPHLHEKWPEADITGIDNSKEMLTHATRTYPGFDFLEVSAQDWIPKKAPDLIFSNASLHWINDHNIFFPKLFSFLSHKGVLAIQMPNNFSAPSHTIIRECAGTGPWADKLRDKFPASPIKTPDEYYRIFHPLTDQLNIWQTTYTHILSGPDAVYNWLSGSVLRYDNETIDKKLYDEFREKCRQNLSKAYPQSGKETLFPFTRIFMVANKT